MTEFTIQKKKEVTEIKEVRQPKNDYSKYALSEEEIKKLLDAATQTRDKAILLLMLHSALRRMEVVNLRVEDIDWERSLIHLKIYKGKKFHPKNDEELTIPASEKCMVFLRMVKDNREKGWLFVPRDKSSSMHITPEEINYLVASLGKKAGLTNPITKKDVTRTNGRNYQLYKNINPHLLRHTCIRLYLARGGDIRMAQKLARHSRIGLTLETYGTPSIADRDKEYRQIVDW